MKTLHRPETHASPEPSDRPGPRERAAQERGDRTRIRILDAAEELFAHHGFDAVSIRAITDKAKVNSAAIHYHFGSKARLFEAVFKRRIDPINEERRRRLREHAAEVGTGSPSVEKIVAAFIEPYLVQDIGTAKKTAIVRRFLARSDGSVTGKLGSIIASTFDETWTEFVDMLRRALPDVPKKELYWRFFLMISTLYSASSERDWLKDYTGGKCDPADVKAMSKSLLPFLIRGMDG